jgi:hypothetical protein
LRRLFNTDFGFTKIAHHHDGNPMPGPQPPAYRSRYGLEEDECDEEERNGEIEILRLRPDIVGEAFIFGFMLAGIPRGSLCQ